MLAWQVNFFYKVQIYKEIKSVAILNKEKTAQNCMIFDI